MYRRGNPPTILVGMQMVKPLWKTARRFLKTLNTEVSYDPAIPFLGLGPERITIQNDTCTLTITTAKTQNSPLTENEDCVAHLYTGMLLSHKDVPRNYHPNGVNQGEKDRYPAGAHTGGPINSSQ